eukprot:16440782-Heterocapsa_arctica.AAC.1
MEDPHSLNDIILNEIQSGFSSNGLVRVHEDGGKKTDGKKMQDTHYLKNDILKKKQKKKTNIENERKKQEEYENK